MNKVTAYSKCGPWWATAWCLVLGWGGALTHASERRQGGDKKPDTAETALVRADKLEQSEAAGDRVTLERLFEQTMTGARLEGVSQMTAKGDLHGDRALSAPRKDGYVISKVSKIGGDRWLVFARIPMGDQRVDVPVPVRVVWAGDTAVITLDDVGVPLIGTYSARVMIHQGFYSGIWYSNGKNYGGVMAGRIIRDTNEDTDKVSDKGIEKDTGETKETPSPAEDEHKDAPPRTGD